MALNGAWAQSKGYSLGADRVEVRTQAHWQAWGFPSDMVTITPSGSVQSRFIQVPHNAILNVADFSYPIDGSLRDQYANSFQDENNNLLARGGVKRAGSNPQLAERAMDADPATAWEPDPGRSPAGLGVGDRSWPSSVGHQGRCALCRRRGSVPAIQGAFGRRAKPLWHG